MCVSASGEIHTKQVDVVTLALIKKKMLLPQKITSVCPVQTETATVQQPESEVHRSQWNPAFLKPVVSASIGRRREPCLCYELLPKHLSICYLICVLAAGSVLDPEFSPYHMAALFYFNKRCALVLAPGMVSMDSSEACCTWSWHATGPTLSNDSGGWLQ